VVGCISSSRIGSTFTRSHVYTLERQNVVSLFGHNHLPLALLVERHRRHNRVAEYRHWAQASRLKHRDQLGVAIQPDAIARMARLDALARQEKAILDLQYRSARLETRLTQHIAAGNLVPANPKALQIPIDLVGVDALQQQLAAVD